jgi:TonB family protein
MTSRRLIASLTASAAALALVTIVAVRAFPLEAQTQPTSNTGQPVQIVQGGEHLLHVSLPEYPKRAIEQRVAGDVLLDLVIDDRGEVSDARVVAGPDELRRAALESALNWHYSPASVATTTIQATLRFRLPAQTEVEGYRAAFERKEESKGSEAEHAEHVIAELRTALEDPAASPEQKNQWRLQLAEREAQLLRIRYERARLGERVADGPPALTQIRSERVTPEILKEVVDRAGITVGTPITEDTAKRISRVAAEIDEHLRVNFRDDGKGGMILMIESQ